MSRINTNIPSLIARANLGRSEADLNVRLERLSTGLRINRGADDPAGLIISERLGSEISGLQQAIRNSERASSVIATAEAALAEVADLLNSIRGLVVEAANTGAISDEEREANQLQINSAIDSITRIASSASFGGLNLLNGSLDYVLSGVSSSAVTTARIFGANFVNRSSISVDVETIASAQTGALFLRGDYAAGPFGNGRLQSSVTLEIAGPLGVQTVSFLSGVTLDRVRDSINTFRDATGVSAALINGDINSGIVFSSVGFGSGDFVSVTRLGTSGEFFETYSFDADGPVPAAIDIPALIAGGQLTVATRDDGRDVFAIVNGTLATGDGLRLSLPDNGVLSLELLLNSDLATRNGATTSFRITGGGALYQLGGDVSVTQQINISLPSVTASRIGGSLISTLDGPELQFLDSLRSGGQNDLRSLNFTNASTILSAAIDEIALIRGRLGALERNTLDTNVRSIQTAVENLSASRSLIRDADFAAETSELTRAQILSQASTSALQLANQQSQNVLALLGG
ncbi:MAG: flagellin, partial [Planctomyces sp.]|nr:flagellin [Planctomyces sp.]